ncbi:alpha-2-macroglobulin family protein [Hymenobacter sp. GOD-10R]|uniref:alpha-2-macroglobulin family protein n=1 Tax=Hymenobacter sp. GOD-10R TaxID=3093922 RepID=UPI002D79C802|nr:alpha-2-macroglobulin family protein [Hymenobacter sp. GOD-10R]WRQ29616.1 alpha-2-macroglobulin family protein [Hymenobacter sp. GOD-10R]
MRPFLLLCLFLLLLFNASSSAPTPPTGPNPKKWKQIDALLAKDRTIMAGELVDEIYRAARRQQDTPEYLRALLYKLRLLEAKEENADEKAIALLKDDLKTARFPARPILHSLLAQLYARYYQQHRYQLYDRTRIATPDSADLDLATWDAARLGSAIVRHYQASVAEEPQRQQKLLINDLGYAIRGGDVEGRALRPTLYDVLVHRAVEGLGNDEYYITRPAAKFRLTNRKLLGPAAEFVGLSLQAPAADSLNGQFHALWLLQQLTAFRLSKASDLAALADADLSRLAFVHQHAEFANKDSLYRKALSREAEYYKALSISAEFLVEEAHNWRQSQQSVKARTLALEAERRFPASHGAKLAAVLRQGIEAVELRFTTEEVVLPNQPWLLKLEVRNVTRLYAKAYRVSTAQALRQLEQQQPSVSFSKTYARTLAAAPAASWTLDVPSSQDYTSHTVQQVGPALPLGYYLVVVSTTEQGSVKQQPERIVVYGQLAVSELSHLQRPRTTSSSGVDMLVLHRQSGLPLPGVKAQPFYRKNYVDPLRPVAAQTTNEAGHVLLLKDVTPDQPTYATVLLSRDADSLVAKTIYYGSFFPRNPIPEETRRVFLFTDRAIYRPGQTLYFKGILTEERAGTSQLLPDKGISVRLLDVNRQTVQTLTFTTSDFGSFHGSMVLPTSLLNGEMSLQTNFGELSFAVEDYKRPTFQVAFEPIKGKPVLGKAVTMRGLGTAYAGQPIDGATVQYRVVRRTLWLLVRPYLGGQYEPFPGQAEVEIANGTTQTAADGSFSVTFTAQADTSVDRNRKGWRPGYFFEVTADVTDAAGETRTAQQQVSLGSSTLNLQFIMPQLLNREQVPALKLLSTNGLGQEAPARGQVRLYRLTPPARSLRPRPWERLEREALSREEFKRQFPLDAYADEDDERKWARTLVLTEDFDTEKTPVLTSLVAPLQQQPPGRYLLEATATDADQVVKAEQFFTLYAPSATTLAVPTPNWFVSLQDSVLPGQTARFLLGSSEAGARVLVEIEAGGKSLQQEWITLTAGAQRQLAIPVPADLGETQLFVHTTQVRDNRLYTNNSIVQVAKPAEPLALSIATFHDKLQPGQKETWRITIHNAAGKAAEAELVATLYDQSLDHFRMHHFSELAFPQPYYPTMLGWNGRFELKYSMVGVEGKSMLDMVNEVAYPRLNLWGYQGEQVMEPVKEVVETKVYTTPRMNKGVRVTLRGTSSLAQPAPMAAQLDEVQVAGYGAQQQSISGSVTTAGAPQADLSLIQARQNFQETAFWRPDLRTNNKGEIVLEFQMPEAVTRWQLLALAHDKQLHAGLLRRTLVTQKQLQVTPNAPRFFREGDQLRFTAKVSNLTAQPVGGTAQLFLFDARTQQPLESKLLKTKAQQKFAVNANQSSALSWDLAIPETADGQVPLEAITYRVVAQTEPAKKRKSSKQESFSDGEENTLPVLPNRLLVTEALPLSVIGPNTQTFELKKLTSTTSPTRRNYSLTLEMSQNPAWYAVQALPYLMEYPYECSEQIFSRFYASVLAAKILQSNPRIKPVLAEWKRVAQGGNKQALTSKLEQNQELKNLLLQETPWMRDAQTDTERMRRLGELFDEPRLQAETSKALTKLAQLQQPNGAFPWFEKMPDDRYITQLIVAGLGKLQKLGAFDATQDEQAKRILQNALGYLDAQLQQEYDALRQGKGINMKANHLSDVQIQALYARSFWPQQPVAKGAQSAVAYYQQQAATYWKEQTRYLQAQLALALHRQKNQPAAVQNIMTALRENALHDPELGMYWKDVRGGYYWREAPTETQATLIEAFDEVANDQKAVDEMKLWLLRQKQTQNWPSTRATADACYALLLRGSDWLQPSQPVVVKLGEKPVQPSSLEAGTGYFRTTFPAAEVKAEQGRVAVTKSDAGLAWGALYWQYFEQLDKLTPAATSLSLERQLFREQRTAGGPVLEKLTSTAPLRVGDVLVVRLILRSDRDLEYVHLKDQRAAGLELINQVSGYQYQAGLGYYESPRDAATNFFISYFPKGTHTFEYRLRASQSGDFSGGLSQLQCLYAPEFTTHSAGTRMQIAPQL